MRKPTFLYIGAAKAGSTWLSELLRAHPEVYLPPVKDVQFFDHQFDKGTDWYYGHFRGAGTARAVGELSHDYFLSEAYARRIHGELPEVRLIACLRDPVDRAASKYTFSRSTERCCGPPQQFCGREDIVAEGDYLKNLRPFYELFPRETILVLFYDEIREDPAGVARRLYDFVGVDPGFRPPVLGEVVLGAQQARVPVIAHACYSAAKLLRRAGLANLVGVVKRSPLTNALLYRRLTRRPGLPDRLKGEIYARYRDDYPALERLIGRRLPQAWHRHAPLAEIDPAVAERAEGCP